MVNMDRDKLPVSTYNCKILLFAIGVVITTCVGVAKADNITKMAISDHNNEVLVTLPFDSVDECRFHRDSMAIMAHVLVQHRGATTDPIYVTCTPVPHGESEAL